jgi:hypothetical protein
MTQPHWLSTPTTVVDALGERRHLVLVAQSFRGFIAPLLSERVPVDLMVLVAAMIPSLGEAPNDYWTTTGISLRARSDGDC